jgi:hypothetical protein
VKGTLNRELITVKGVLKDGFVLGGLIKIAKWLSPESLHS